MNDTEIVFTQRDIDVAKAFVEAIGYPQLSYLFNPIRLENKEAAPVFDDLAVRGLKILATHYRDGVDNTPDALQAESQMAIRIEKLLLEQLGREWTPTGISVVNLIKELGWRARSPKSVGQEPPKVRYFPKFLTMVERGDFGTKVKGNQQDRYLEEWLNSHSPARVVSIQQLSAGYQWNTGKGSSYFALFEIADTGDTNWPPE